MITTDGWTTTSTATTDPWWEDPGTTAILIWIDNTETSFRELIDTSKKALQAIYAYEKDRESWSWPRAKNLYTSHVPYFSLVCRRLLVSISGWVTRKLRKIKPGN